MKIPKSILSDGYTGYAHPQKLIKLFTLFTEDVGISNHLEI